MAARQRRQSLQWILELAAETDAELSARLAMSNVD
jgi:hypothetical protein